MKLFKSESLPPRLRLDARQKDRLWLYLKTSIAQTRAGAFQATAVVAASSSRISSVIAHRTETNPIRNELIYILIFESFRRCQPLATQFHPGAVV